MSPFNKQNIFSDLLVWFFVLAVSSVAYSSCTESAYSEADRQNLTDYEKNWVSAIGSVDKRHKWNSAMGVTLSYYVEEDATLTVYSIDEDLATSGTVNDKSRILRRIVSSAGSHKVLIDVPQHINNLCIEKEGASGGESVVVQVKSMVGIQFKNSNSSANWKPWKSCSMQSWYIAFEDCNSPYDYDFNDVVLRLTPYEDYSKINVELCAAGSEDEIYIYFQPGAKQEPVLLGIAHEAFGVKEMKPINTSITFMDPVNLGDYVLPEGFSMSSNASLFYIQPYETYARYSMPTSSGCVPKAFCVPTETWRWPSEFMFVGDAYPKFKAYSKDCLTYGDWYTEYYPYLVITQN